MKTNHCIVLGQRKVPNMLKIWWQKMTQMKPRENSGLCMCRAKKHPNKRQGIPRSPDFSERWRLLLLCRSISVLVFSERLMSSIWNKMASNDDQKSGNGKQTKGHLELQQSSSSAAYVFRHGPRRNDTNRRLSFVIVVVAIGTAGYRVNTAACFWLRCLFTLRLTFSWKTQGTSWLENNLIQTPRQMKELFQRQKRRLRLTEICFSSQFRSTYLCFCEICCVFSWPFLAFSFLVATTASDLQTCLSGALLYHLRSQGKFACGKKSESHGCVTTMAIAQCCKWFSVLTWFACFSMVVRRWQRSFFLECHLLRSTCPPAQWSHLACDTALSLRWTSGLSDKSHSPAQLRCAPHQIPVSQSGRQFSPFIVSTSGRQNQKPLRELNRLIVHSNMVTRSWLSSCRSTKSFSNTERSKPCWSIHLDFVRLEACFRQWPSFIRVHFHAERSLFSWGALCRRPRAFEVNKQDAPAETNKKYDATKDDSNDPQLSVRMRFRFVVHWRRNRQKSVQNSKEKTSQLSNPSFQAVQQKQHFFVLTDLGRPNFTLYIRDVHSWDLSWAYVLLSLRLLCGTR